MCWHHQTCFHPLCDCGPAGHLHTSCLGQWYTRQLLAPQQPAPLESNAGVHRQNPMAPCHCSLLHLYAASSLTSLHWCTYFLLCDPMCILICQRQSSIYLPAIFDWQKRYNMTVLCRGYTAIPGLSRISNLKALFLGDFKIALSTGQHTLRQPACCCRSV